MDIINYNVDWARGEVFSAKIIALMMLGSFLMAVDSNAKARNYDYRQQLLQTDKREAL